MKKLNLGISQENNKEVCCRRRRCKKGHGSDLFCEHNKDNEHHKRTSRDGDKKPNLVFFFHKNNKTHQCSCRHCFSGMVNTITNQGFHTVSLYTEVCIELTLRQTEFSDIISVFTHVDIYTVIDLGGGHLVSTHFEGQYVINALKDTMEQVAMVMLLCIQRICLQLHHRMLFITPLYQVDFHNENNSHDHTPIVRSVAPKAKQLKVSDSLKIQGLRRFLIFDLLTVIFTFFSNTFVHAKKNLKCVAEEKHEVLEKSCNEKENEKNSDNRTLGDDDNKNFSEDTLSILFPSLEIRPQEILAFPATQQPVLEPILNKFSTPESPPSKHDTMAVEFLRLCTMHDYPNTNGPSLLRLAQAGFFYEGNGNELVCFSCDFRKGSWNFNDSPREIHLRMSPNCKFLSQGGDGNVPVPREESMQDLVPLQSIPQAGVVEPDGPRATSTSSSNNTAHLASANYSDGRDQPDVPRRTMAVKHPEYAGRPARLASYANFPRHMKQHPADMTDAGFYYAGFGDCCRCYHCGIGLRNWDPEDNPWIEHARWSEECPYILKIKGQAFIDLVQEAARAAEMAQDDEDSEAEGENAANDSDSGNKEKSGASNSSSGGPAANEIENNVAKTSEATMSKGTSDDSGFGSGSAPVAQPIKAPLRTAAAQSLIHDEKIKPKYVTAAIEDLVKAEGWGAFSKENIRKYLKIHEENRKSASSASNADPNSLKQENKELKDLTICKICLDEKVSIVFLPCGHLVSCPQCAPALTKCPICRKSIKGTVRTNLVEKSTAK